MKIHRDLLDGILGRIAPAVETTDNSAEFGRYIVVKTKADTLSIGVVRQDMCAIVSVDDAQKSLLESDSDVSFAVDGTELVEAIDGHSQHEMINVDFKALDPNKTTAASPTGSTIFSLKDEYGENESFELSCVEMDASPTIVNDVNEQKSVTVKGSDFIKYVQSVYICTGKAIEKEEYSNILLRTKGNEMDIITANRLNLALATIDCVSKTNDIAAVAPYNLVAQIAKMLIPTENVEIIYNAGSPGTLVFKQDFRYGDHKVGTACFRTTCSLSKFIAFESSLAKIDFNKFRCVIDTQILKRQLRKISFLKSHGTFFLIDGAKQSMTVSKEHLSGSKKNPYHIPMKVCPSSDLSLELSSGFLDTALSVCEMDDTEIGFSGAKTLYRIILGSRFKAYYSPFNK